MDANGLICGVELWQNGQHILISMSSWSARKNGYRWCEIKDFLDSVQPPKYVEIRND